MATTENSTVTFDVGNWPTVSGSEVSLYLIPAKERESGVPHVYTFGIVGAGTPEAALHGRELYLGRVPLSTDADSLREWLQCQEDEIVDLSDQYQGSEWNGNNHVGNWGDLARELNGFDRALEQAITNEQIAQHWDAGEWLSGDPAGTIEAALDRSDLDAAIADVMKEGETRNALLDREDVSYALTSMIRDAIEDEEDRSRRDKIRALLGEPSLAAVRIDPSEIVVPPECQGQTIEYAYGTAEDGVVMRVHDRSKLVGPQHYYAPWEAVAEPDAWAPWNAEPEIDEDAWQDAIIAD